MKLGFIFAEHIYTKRKTRRYNADSGRMFPFRDYIFLLVLCLVIGLLIVRLIAVEIFQGTYYRILADSNRTRTKIIHAPRGIIFDRNGVPLVYNTPGFREEVNGKTVFLSQDEALSLIAQGNKNL